MRVKEESEKTGLKFNIQRLKLWPLVSVCVCVCLVAQSCPTLCDTMDCSLPGSSVHADSPGKNTGVGCHTHPPGDLSDPEIGPTSPAAPELQANSLPQSPQGKLGSDMIAVLSGQNLSREK